MWKSLTMVTELGAGWREYTAVNTFLLITSPLPVIAGLLALSCDHGVMNLILSRLDEGDLELGRVSELEVCLPVPAGRIKHVSLQVLMITTTYPGKL